MEPEILKACTTVLNVLNIENEFGPILKYSCHKLFFLVSNLNF